MSSFNLISWRRDSPNQQGVAHHRPAVINPRIPLKTCPLSSVLCHFRSSSSRKCPFLTKQALQAMPRRSPSSTTIGPPSSWRSPRSSTFSKQRGAPADPELSHGELVQLVSLIIEEPGHPLPGPSPQPPGKARTSFSTGRGEYVKPKAIRQLDAAPAPVRIHHPRSRSTSGRSRIR